jgi:hypothetical protein
LTQNLNHYHCLFYRLQIAEGDLLQGRRNLDPRIKKFFAAMPAPVPPDFYKLTRFRFPVTAEVAGSSPVVPAVILKRLG